MKDLNAPLVKAIPGSMINPTDFIDMQHWEGYVPYRTMHGIDIRIWCCQRYCNSRFNMGCYLYKERSCSIILYLSAAINQFYNHDTEITYHGEVNKKDIPKILEIHKELLNKY